jgi:hypothetical protein
MRIPTFADKDLNKFFVDWQREIDQMKKDKFNALSANKSVLLYSPSKKVYEITVTDAGALVVTKVSDG